MNVGLGLFLLRFLLLSFFFSSGVDWMAGRLSPIRYLGSNRSNIYPTLPFVVFIRVSEIFKGCSQLAANMCG